VDDQAASGNGMLAAHAVLAKIQWALRSDPGCERAHNEDFAGVFASTAPDDAWDRGPLFVVADGLGGHAAGEVASRLAVEAAVQAWVTGTPPPPQSAIRAAVRAAHIAVYDAALERGKRGMGTTLVAATLSGREAIVAHVGDSRAYHVRGDVCRQLTADHSRVAEMVRMKIITPEQAATHPSRSMLTRSLGGEPSVQIDISNADLAAGDALVLCSDGLWGLVSQVELTQEILRLGTPAAPTPVATVDALVDLAIKRGAPDNVTCLVIRVTSDRPIPAAGAKRGLFRRPRS
jgi:serine/threonine protein phosphatase PrpC